MRAKYPTQRPAWFARDLLRTVSALNEARGASVQPRTIVVHRAGKSWNAYVPDLDGVVATAATRERVVELITQAIPYHLERIAESETSEP